MSKYPIGLFWIAEINLILWLMNLGAMIPLHFNDSIDAFQINCTIGGAGVGLLLAMGFQHWAYYKIYKPAKRDKAK